MFNEIMRAEIWLQDTLEDHVGIEDLAERLGYSSSQIRRSFRQCFGISPGAYRDRLRLEKAARLLIHTPLEVKTITRQCGYLNHSAFSRAFQRRYRCSPREFRQSERAKLRASHVRWRKPFPMSLRRTTPGQAIVTRLYKRSQEVDDPADWQRQAEGGEGLVKRLGHSTPIVLLHDHPLVVDLPRIDIGVKVPCGEASNVALPPAFRQVHLPSRHCACLTLDTIDELSQAMHFLMIEALPRLSRHFNGEPPRLLRRQADLELQLPLMEGDRDA